MSRIVLRLLLSSPTLFISCQNINNSSSVINNVTAEEFKRLIRDTNAVLVDVRTSGEFSNGHIDGALLMDFYKKGFHEQILALDKNAPILLYCRSGNRSYQTARFMEGHGFTKVYNLKSGIIDWNRNNFELMAGDL